MKIFWCVRRDDVWVSNKLCNGCQRDFWYKVGMATELDQEAVPAVISFDDEHEAFAARYDSHYSYDQLTESNTVVEQHNLFMFQIKIHSFQH